MEILKNRNVQGKKRLILDYKDQITMLKIVLIFLKLILF